MPVSPREHPPVLTAAVKLDIHGWPPSALQKTLVDFNKAQPALKAVRNTVPGLYFLLQSMTPSLISLSCFSREEAMRFVEQLWHRCASSESAEAITHSQQGYSCFLPCEGAAGLALPHSNNLAIPIDCHPSQQPLFPFSLPFFTLLQLTGQPPCSFIWHQCLFLK